jgi:hypothetical protein
MTRIRSVRPFWLSFAILTAVSAPTAAASANATGRASTVLRVTATVVHSCRLEREPNAVSVACASARGLHPRLIAWDAEGRAEVIRTATGRFLILPSRLPSGLCATTSLPGALRAIEGISRKDGPQEDDCAGSAAPADRHVRVDVSF